MKRYFQPLDGERMDETWTLRSMFSEDGLVFCEFDNGETINIEYIAPMTETDIRVLFGSKRYILVEIPGPDNRWRSETIASISVKDKDGFVGEVPPIEDYRMKNGGNDTIEKSSIGQKRLIPPSISTGIIYGGLPKLDDFRRRPADESHPAGGAAVPQHSGSLAAATAAAASRPDLPDGDPVSLLVSKAKKSPVTISLVVSINAPSRAIYDACADFENGADDFIARVVDASGRDILDAAKDALKKRYSE